LYFVAFDQDREHAFTYYRAGSAASALTPADIDDSYIRSARLLHTSGITQAISDSARAAADKAIDIARAAGVPVSYDANLRPKLRATEELRETFVQTIARADIVFTSEQDAALVYGDAPPGDVTKAVLSAGAKVAVLKGGERGCVVACADCVSEISEGFPVDRLDASGAGDAFAAAFVVEWLKEADLSAAARFANAVGAITATGLGAVSAVPTIDEVVDFLRRVEDRPARTVQAET
jgi:2-dehydro-3-deoxygluconokinase